VHPTAVISMDADYAGCSRMQYSRGLERERRLKDRCQAQGKQFMAE